MLVLTRRPNEVINIGDNIVVKVISVKDGNHVLIGVEAPRDIPVHRAEVYARVKKERETAAREREAVPA